jgi:hypothetical protein
MELSDDTNQSTSIFALPNPFMNKICLNQITWHMKKLLVPFYNTMSNLQSIQNLNIVSQLDNKHSC